MTSGSKQAFVDKQTLSDTEKNHLAFVTLVLFNNFHAIAKTYSRMQLKTNILSMFSQSFKNTFTSYSV